MKRCSKCGVPKPLDQFHRMKSRKDRRTNTCKACRSEHYRRGSAYRMGEKLARKGPYCATEFVVVYEGKASASQKYCSTLCGDYWRRYKLTKVEIENLLEDQNGGCGICRTENPGDKRGWTVDHDHACCAANPTCGKCVRGILCYKCNLALGLLADNLTSLQNAIDYLVRGV